MSPSVFYTLSLHDALPICITSGASNENLVLSITVSASDPAIVGNLSATYTNPATTGFLTFTPAQDRKCTRLNSSHRTISYPVSRLKKKTTYLYAVAALFSF